MITSTQNPKLKLARSLMGRPKERHAARAFVAEGVRLVEEALSCRVAGSICFIYRGVECARPGTGKEVAKRKGSKWSRFRTCS